MSFSDLAAAFDFEEVLCEVCDKPGDLEWWWGDIPAHAKCVPAYLAKDRRESEEYMAEVHKRPRPEWRSR